MVNKYLLSSSENYLTVVNCCLYFSVSEMYVLGKTGFGFFSYQQDFENDPKPNTVINYRCFTSFLKTAAGPPKGEADLHSRKRVNNL